MNLEIKKVLDIEGKFKGLNVIIDGKRTKLQYSGYETSATKEDVIKMIDYYTVYVEFYRKLLSLCDEE